MQVHKDHLGHGMRVLQCNLSVQCLRRVVHACFTAQNTAPDAAGRESKGLHSNLVVIWKGAKTAHRHIHRLDETLGALAAGCDIPGAAAMTGQTIS